VTRNYVGGHKQAKAAKSADEGGDERVMFTKRIEYTRLHSFNIHGPWALRARSYDTRYGCLRCEYVVVRWIPGETWSRHQG
jgi:hypothetical protein